MDHTTGQGWVAAKQGAYHDALVNKRSTVVPYIVEATGGIAPHSRAKTRCLAKRAGHRSGNDRTKYDLSRVSTRSFYTHHTQRITTAVVKYDALNALDEITQLKVEASRLPMVATAALSA